MAVLQWIEVSQHFHKYISSLEIEFGNLYSVAPVLTRFFFTNFHSARIIYHLQFSNQIRLQAALSLPSAVIGPDGLPGCFPTARFSQACAIITITIWLSDVNQKSFNNIWMEASSRRFAMPLVDATYSFLKGSGLIFIDLNAGGERGVRNLSGFSKVHAVLHAILLEYAIPALPT